jgi:hypothetical protein
VVRLTTYAFGFVVLDESSLVLALGWRRLGAWLARQDQPPQVGGRDCIVEEEEVVVGSSFGARAWASWGRIREGIVVLWASWGRRKSCSLFAMSRWLGRHLASQYMSSSSLHSTYWLSDKRKLESLRLLKSEFLL